MKKRIVLLVLSILILRLSAIADGVGSFSMFASLDPNGLIRLMDARALAMGRASLAVPDSGLQAIWEPGLHPILPSRATGPLLGLQFPSTSSQFLETAFGWRDLALSLSASRFARKFAFLTSAGEPGGNSTWVEEVISASAVASLGNNGALGTQLNYYFADSGLGDSGSGLGLDIGGVFEISDEGLVSFRAKDLGDTEVEWGAGATDLIVGSAQFGLGTTSRASVGLGMSGLAMNPSHSFLALLRGALTLGTNSYASFGGAYVRRKTTGHDNDTDRAIDAGAMLQFGRNLTLAVDWQGILPLGKPDVGEATDRRAAVGLAWHVPHIQSGALDFGRDIALFAADASIDRSGVHLTGLGVEWNIHHLERDFSTLSLRAGVALDSEARSGGLTLGAGLNTDRVRLAVASLISEMQLKEFVLSAEAVLTWTTYPPVSQDPPREEERPTGLIEDRNLE